MDSTTGTSVIHIFDGCVWPHSAAAEIIPFEVRPASKRIRAGVLLLRDFSTNEFFHEKIRHREIREREFVIEKLVIEKFVIEKFVNGNSSSRIRDREFVRELGIGNS